MTDLATAYANAGKALLDLADAISNDAGPLSPLGYEDTPTRRQDAPGATVTDTVPPWTETDNWPEQPWEDQSSMSPRLRPEVAPAGHAAVCPAHNIEYRKGRYGPYCPSTSDDPKWSNDKGYCVVTPKSAAAWLRQHA